jgi:hypothetical protein
MAAGDRLFYGLSHGVGRAGDGQASKLAVMIRIRVKPDGRDEWRSQWGEHLRARAEANPAQEPYLVVTTQLTLTWCTCSSSMVTRRRCSGTRPRSGSPRAGPLLAEPPVVATGNAGAGERRADMSSWLTPCRGAAGQAGLGEDGMDVVLHGRQRDGQGPGDLLGSSCLRIPGRRPGVRGRSAW